MFRAYTWLSSFTISSEFPSSDFSCFTCFSNFAIVSKCSSSELIDTDDIFVSFRSFGPLSL